jgi:hypothetical protein
MARSKPQEGVSILCRRKTKWESLTDLPAGIIGESSDLHAVRGAARPWCAVTVVVVSAAAAAAAARAAGALFTVAGAAGELDREAFTHEVGSVLSMLSLARAEGSGRSGWFPKEEGLKRTEGWREACLVSQRDR